MRSLRQSPLVLGPFAALFLASGCGSRGAARPAIAEQSAGDRDRDGDGDGDSSIDSDRSSSSASASSASSSSPRRPAGVSTAPRCARPGEVIGVCSISYSGVTIQARNLRPGAKAAVQLDGDYATRVGCRRRWHQDVIVDPGGVVTARFDIPTTDRCALLAAMVVAVYVLPHGPDLGPVRFGTIPPP